MSTGKTEAKTKTVPIYNARTGQVEEMEKVAKSDAEWQRILPPETYLVARKSGTEPPFTGKYHDFHGEGIYQCTCCHTDLFNSRTKFESGTGWPSFWAPVSDLNILKKEDHSFFMRRIEALCARCDAHLGHVFDDGPPPTGKRYCMNSASLYFVPEEEFK